MPVVPSRRVSDPPRVVVAGHVCLDVIPRLWTDPGRRALRPGALDLVGPATLAVGGSVGNTGVALRRLGLRPRLVARVGDDPFGWVLTGLLGERIPEDDLHLITVPGGQTSFSLVFNLPGRDRSIQHSSGVNETFVADDVPDEALDGAALLHVGYPPLMAAMIADDGLELRRLLARARTGGAITSLDMASANLDPGETPVRWRTLLEQVLPDVDVFLPSLGEAAHLLRRRVRRGRDGAPALDSVARLADELVAMGVAIAGIKLGEHGLYVRTAGAARLATRGGLLAPEWAERELYSTVFETEVAGTAGAGDTTIAGLLFGLLTGMTPHEAVTAACAVGGASTEAVDGTSAVPAWPEIERRLSGGWRRRAAAPGPGWIASGPDRPWHGPRDARGDGAGA
jgi:sugar/nucleoside kinase (ribokinase family)